MATVNTIENRILEMDGGEFQKLCDAYLYAIQYGKPNSTGGVAGANKVRTGTPDTFFELPNGKLIFAEYTVQKDRLFEKLMSDLGKCFDEEKTEVPVSKIEEVVLCYTGQIKPAEVLSLKSVCRDKGVKLTLFSISALSNDLLNHPLLIRNFLNLAIDTGQVIPLEAFPAVYGKSKFATTLDTNFHFREKEIEDLSNNLESNDLIIISGKAGVGKSRFALEGCRNFAVRHSEYQAYSIVSLSPDLFEDLQERFLLPGHFLILVDDANRVVKFSYFMHFLRTQRDNQHIKIVVTVRDYALNKIEDDISSYPHHSIQLDRFTDDQIKELSKDEFGILNPSYLERIVSLSGGNPRIAVMISKIAKEKNNLQSINDISALYDEYFSSIKEDLQNFGESNLLKAAGIIAFLRAVDRTNEQMMLGVEKAFRIPRDVFWDCAFRLHELEMVDMYEDEVVRISDQVLSTYLFYSAFLKEKVLDFSDILQNYFPGFRSKINDSLYPVMSAFDQNTVSNLIRPKVQNKWDNLAVVNDDESLLALAESFWHLLPETTLSFIKKRLSQSQFAPADFSQLDQLDTNKLNNVQLIAELQLLGQFRYETSDLRNIALELLFTYLNSRPAEILPILHVLVNDFGFDRFSNQTGVSVQQRVVDLLWEHTENGQNELYSRLFISVAGEYLKTHFQTNEMRSKMTFTMYSFTLQPSPEVFQLRTTLFAHLFELYTKYPKYVFTVVQNYANAYQHAATPDEIFSNDAISLLGFAQKNLVPQNLPHSIFVNNYLDFLEVHEVTFGSIIREKFKTDTFLVYRLLSESRKDLLQYKYEEYQRIRKESFISYFASFSEMDIKHFIDLCLEVGNSVKQDRNQYEIITGFNVAVSVLAETRPDVFEAALGYYLQQGDILELNPYLSIRSYMTIYGKEKTFKFFSKQNYPSKNRWLFGYYQMLPLEKIEANDLPPLLKLFQDAEYSQLPDHLDFLLEYVSFDNRIVAKAAQFILDKGDFQYSAWKLNSITNPYFEIHKHLLGLFKKDVETLKKAYLTVKAGKDHDDHNSATLSKILELDPEFIVQYIEWIYAPKGDGSRWYHDSQNYSILWRHSNYRTIFRRIVELVYKKEENPHWHTELRQFFIPNEESRLDADIEHKQEELLTELINVHHQDARFIEFLFEVVAYFPKERRSHFVYTFLQHNKIFSHFQRLAIEPRGMSWSGSAVPLYQERIDNLKSLLPMLDNAELLEHRVYIQQRIDSLENQKKLEKKRDFIGDDGL